MRRVGLRASDPGAAGRVTRRAILRGALGWSGAALAGGLLGSCGLGTPPASPTPGGDAGRIVFLSSQFKPAEEAERMRRAILGPFPGRVEYLPEDPEPFNDRLRREANAGQPTVSLIGGLHGDFAAFARDGLLQDLTPLLGRLAGRAFPPALAELGRFGTHKQFYIPWFQATYLMAASKAALPYLPPGARIEALTYPELTAWGAAIVRATGARRIGLPGGPRGLLNRFIQGYLYPSFTGSAGVAAFRSPEAARMWADFRDLWATVHPQSVGFEFMQEPLATGEVWIAWDHVARLSGALNERPGDFVVFPAPAGPRGRGFLTIIGGLAIPKGAPNTAGAERLIDYLTRPEGQGAMLKELAFFPVTGVPAPPDLAAGIALEAAAVAQQSAAEDGVPALLPVGLGARGNDFNRVYLETFTRIVLKNEPPATVLDEQAPALQAILNETQAPCWPPDPASAGPCVVR
jgi:multiple sugar transport system substrate-binding protein